MSVMFEPTEINGMEIKNRFVRSATWAGLADKDGGCTPDLVALMARLAEGQVGLIITGHAYVLKEGQAGPWQLGIYSDELIGGLQEMTRAVHDRGGRIVAQIAHAGYLANAKLTGQAPRAPSAVNRFARAPREPLSTKQIQDVVAGFGQAARRAKEAGFDGVQIHSAHGYLLSQFLSPAFNQRTDGYGGSLENRARAPMEVLQRVRDTVGPGYPVLAKVNSEDFLDGGITLEDAVKVGAMLADGGLDALEVSGGTPVSGKWGPSRRGVTSQDREAYFREAARSYKDRVDVPIMLVGGIRTFSLAEEIVTGGDADYISMSRPFIREPGLIRRWASGDRSPAACISDSQCFDPAGAGDGIYCVVAEQQKDG